MGLGGERAALIAFLFIVVLGGINFVAVRFSNAELPPLWGAGLRFGLAALLFFIIVLVRRITLPRGRALAGAIIYGVLAFGASYALIYYALVSSKAGLASVILALTPLATVLLATAQRQERLTARGLGGGALALVGTGIVFNEQLSLGIKVLPLLALVGAALSAAEVNVILKRFPKSNPYSTNGVAMTTGALMLFGLSAFEGETWTLPSRLPTTVALLYLVVLGSVVLFFLYLFVIARWSASATSYVFVLFPIVTVSVASLLTAEQVTLEFVIGSALVLLGVYLGALVSMKKSSAPDRVKEVSAPKS